MHFSILGSPGSWYFKDLCRAAGRRHTLSACSFERLAAHLHGGDGVAIRCSPNVEPAADALRGDAVLVRTMPPGTLEQVVFRMDALGRLAAQGCPVMNPPRTIEIAVDKFLASARLQAAGLPIPETIVCQSVEQAMAGFVQLGQDIVLKPHFGSEGRGIMRIADENLALRAFKTLTQLGCVIYMQRFIDHPGYDLRVLVIGEQTFAMRRSNADDWRTNVSRGATTTAHVLEDPLQKLALRAAAAVNAPLAGVDILPDRDGSVYVLEVNAVPGWKALARTLQLDIAGHVIRFLEWTVENSDRDANSPSGTRRLSQLSSPAS